MAREDGGISTDLSNSPWTQPAPMNAANPGGNKTGQFSPGRPIMPVNPLERPRVFEYRPGINLVIMPRYGYGLASFDMLRALAAACYQARLNIELIKREVRALDWEIVPVKKDDKTDYSADIAEIERLLESPDDTMDFDNWINAALEEVLVTDALTIYPDKDVEDKVCSLDLIDGTRIRPVLDFRGKIARPPAPGYIQVLYGQPAGSWTKDELIYRPMNQSVNSPYGMSPLEFMLLMVNFALRRDTHHLANYTLGNIPEALVGAPSSWSQDQVNTWQTYWDALVSGNIEQQRKIHWVPVEGGRGQIPVYEFKKDNMDLTAQDEWLMKVACWAFGNSPAEFGLTSGEGLGGAGYANAMADVHQRSMIVPVTSFLAQNITRIIKYHMRKPHLKFAWIGLDQSEDTLKQAQVDNLNLQMGVYDLQYVQDRENIPAERRPVQQPGVMDDGLGGFGGEESPMEGDGFAKSFRSQGGWQQYP